MLSATQTPLLWRADLELGTVSGPLALHVHEDALWVAGGGRGDATLLVHRDDRWSRPARIAANGLRSVLALDRNTILISGEHGHLARSEDGGASFSTVNANTTGCLYGLSVAGSNGEIWVGGDDGVRVSHDQGRSFTKVDVSLGRVFRITTMEDAPLFVAEHCVALHSKRGETIELFSEREAVLNGVARAKSGSLVVVGDGGKAWRSTNGRDFHAVDVGTDADLEDVVIVDDAFVVLGADGNAYVSVDGLAFERIAVFDGLRLSAMAAYRGGHVFAGWREEGPPYRFVGGLAFRGAPERAPTAHGIRDAARVMPPMASPAQPEGSGEASTTAATALIELLSDRQRLLEATATTVRELIAAGADVNARGPNGATALHLFASAAPGTSLDVLDALIAAGADVNATDDQGRTPIMRAPRSEDEPVLQAHSVAVMEKLRAAGGRATAVAGEADVSGTLHSSMPISAYELLIAAGAPLDRRDHVGTMPLHSAVRSGAVERVRVLLRHGADVNGIDGVGRTPLRVALLEHVKPWVKHHKRTADFDAISALLREAGGLEHVTFEWNAADPSSPRPYDREALRQATADREWNQTIKRLIQADGDSIQELIDGLYDNGEPEQSVAFVQALAAVLSPATAVPLNVAGDWTVERPFFWHGDVVVDGNVTLGARVGITGSLRGRVIEDVGNNSRVTIAGDLQCNSLFTSGDFNVGGVLDATGVVYGYYNDFLLSARLIRGRVVIEDDHATSAEVESPDHFDIDTFGGDECEKRLVELFVDDLFDDDASLDRGELFRRLRSGERVFREE